MLRPDPSEPGALREAFSGFPCGVVAIAALVSGEPQVLIASSFTVGVSQDPPLVMFAVQHTSSTWPVLADAPRVGVSVLGDSYAARTRQLAAKDRSSRLDGVTTTTTDTGAVLLHDAPIWLECSVFAVHPAGDHDIVVLRVEELAVEFDHAPLVWHRSGFAALSA